MINLQYTKTDGVYTFLDVLVLEDDHNLSDTEIEDLKELRFQRWIAAVSNSQPVQDILPNLLEDESESLDDA